LAPFSAPLYDNPLDDFFHAFLVALSTIPGALVRPRWQPEPPNLPNFATDWLAWGITEMGEDRFAFQDQVQVGMGGFHGVVERDEILTMLMSFYGPRSAQLAKQVSASIQLGQNRPYLRAQNLTVIEVLDPVKVPALLKEKWVPRVDQRIRFRRRATWAYQIHNVEEFQAQLDNELYSTYLGSIPAPPPG
jgi:hypothetical protein